MRYSSSPGFLGPTASVPPGVKWLLIANTALFVLYFVAVNLIGINPFRYFRLVPYEAVEHLQVWRIFTYLFLHDPTGFGHILLNMLSLYMFGRTLEETWGTERFLRYYFVCGLGAGLCVIVAGYLTGSQYAATIGASGAIFGLLLAFGMLFPDTTLLMSFLFPIKAKYMVMIVGAITFLSSLTANSGVSHIAHLGGMVFGYFYIRSLRRSPAYSRRSGPSLFQRISSAWQDYKIRRARKKFQVYMSRQNRKDDPYVH